MRTLVVVGLLLGSSSPCTAAQTDADPSSLVNPFVGTQNFGNTFPGASVPFGMVQVSPDTARQGGYDYKADLDLRLLADAPVRCRLRGRWASCRSCRPVGSVDNVDINAYKSAFSHDDEAASPGYYRVGLSRYGVNAELTATQRTGWQRYTFPATGAANVLFNTGRLEPDGARLRDPRRRRPDDRGPGAQRPVLRGQGRAHRVLHGVVRPAVRVVRRVARDRSHGRRPGRGRHRWERRVGHVRRDRRPRRRAEGRPVLHRHGGRAEEPRRGDSRATTSTAPSPLPRHVWRKQLDAVRIVRWAAATGRSPSTPRSTTRVLHPNLAGDVDGRYMGFDGKVRTASGYTPYQNFSLWDTYRPQNQLLQMLEPQRRP